MPAWFFGHSRTCWADSDPACVDNKGKAFKGRSCCTKVDVEFRHMEADPVDE
jgi:deoxyribonuclease-1